MWRELLAAGVKTAAITGSGVFKDAASDAALRTAFFTQSLPNWQIVIPSFGTVSGPFKISSLQYDGPYDGEVKISLSLACAGALTLRPLKPPARTKPVAARNSGPCQFVMKEGALKIMPNRIRGEAELMAGGRSYRLLLTLGALAEIEDGLGLENLADVSARLKKVRAADLAIVAAALLRGGGHEVAPAECCACRANSAHWSRR